MFSKTLFLVLLGLAVVLASPVRRDDAENQETEVIEVVGEEAMKIYEELLQKFKEISEAGLDPEKLQKIFKEIQELIQKLKEQHKKGTEETNETEEKKRVRRSIERDILGGNVDLVGIDEETAKKIAEKVKEAIKAFFTEGPFSEGFKQAVREIKELIAEAIEKPVTAETTVTAEPTITTESTVTDEPTVTTDVTVTAQPTEANRIRRSAEEEIPEENENVEVIEIKGEEAQKIFEQIQAKFKELFEAAFNPEKFQEIFKEIQELFKQLKEQQNKETEGTNETEEQKRVRRSIEQDILGGNIDVSELDQVTAKKIAEKVREAIKAFFTQGPFSEGFRQAVREIRKLIAEAVGKNKEPVTTEPTVTAEPTVTDGPTTTAEPTVTDEPITTAEPTVTDAPTNTAEPTVTDEPITVTVSEE